MSNTDLSIQLSMYPLNDHLTYPCFAFRQANECKPGDSAYAQNKKSPFTRFLQQT